MLGKIAIFVMVLAISFGARVEAEAQTTTTASAKSGKTAHKPAVKKTTRPRNAKTTKPAARPSTATRTAAAKKKPAAAQRNNRTAPARTTTRRPVASRTPAARSTKVAGKRIVVASRSNRYGRSAQKRTLSSTRSAYAARRLAYQQGRGTPARRGGTRFGSMPMLPPPEAGATRTLSFYNVHTHQSLTVTFRRGGRYVQSELDRLNDFLRDSRTGEEVQMDPALFDLLWQVRRQLRSNATYHVLSAYRSPQTNAWLASVSSGVASDSLHMRGQAMDVRLPGRTPGQIRSVARALHRGGVGYYPRSGFVHLDTGPVRYW